MGIINWLFGPSKHEKAMETYAARLRYLYHDAILKDGKDAAWILREVDIAKFEFLTH